MFDKNVSVKIVIIDGKFAALHYNSDLILTFCVIIIFASHVIDEYQSVALARRRILCHR
ncbi:hypothetical protein T09_10430 [Trichinella sp. T9]|nr:hypothetical protein T09_10669 [Trichinella sp. T9]KRX40711.1 hypothetical protein T09_13269 [Trichinella sp. T9]KRX41403.1 hypothetical protein T09_10430 [Trichinella sp. T9]